MEIKTTDRGGVSLLVELHKTFGSVSLLSVAPSNAFLTVCSPVILSFNIEGLNGGTHGENSRAQKHK